MLTLTIIVLIGAIIFCLWCSNERKTIQSEQQAINQHNDEADETQTERIEQFILHKSHISSVDIVG